MKKHAARIAVMALVALVLGSGVALAQVETCSAVGTWIMKVPSGGELIAVVTRGNLRTSGGQIEASWVVWEPTLASRFPAVRTTDPKGAWEEVGVVPMPARTNFTWIAHGMGAFGSPLYVLRGRGYVTFQGCDQATFTTAMDLFLPSHNVWLDAPLVTLGPEPWSATRMPVVPLADPNAPVTTGARR